MSVQSAAAAINPINAVPAIVGKMGFDQVNDARKARRAAEKLEADRRAQLAREAADRAAAKKRAETTGQRVGAGSLRTQLVGTFGAGSGNTPPGATPNLFGN